MVIGIVTALEHEYVAVKSILTDIDEIQKEGKGAGRRFTKGKIPSVYGGVHDIILCLGDMGNNAASIYATLLIELFPEDNIEAILMVGIAGGVPNPKKLESHVRLGDIVVSDAGGVMQYDNIKNELNKTSDLPSITYRIPPRPPSAKLLQALRLFNSKELEKNRDWIKHIDHATKILQEFDRPNESLDILHDANGEKIPHPFDKDRTSNEPKVFLGRIGSANTLLKNPVYRDFLSEKYKIKANEMEGSGIADATWISGTEGYIVIRGICDYCDGYKNDVWQRYAALAAAAYTKGFIESIPAKTTLKIYSNQEIAKDETKYLPVEHNKFLTSFFVGRKKLIDDVLRNYIQNPNKNIIALIEKGGIGKTALAAKITDAFNSMQLSTPKSVFMANLNNELPSDIAARWLKHFDLNYDQSNEATRLAMLEKVLSVTPSVIILDNCQNKEDVNKLFIKSLNVFIILTSRKKSVVPAEFELIEIPVLDNQDALELLQKFIGEKRFKDNIESINQICLLCAGIPLALKIAGSELKNEVRWSDIKKYENKLRENTLETLSGNDNTENVRATFDISYENLSNPVKDTFDSLGLFDDSNFPTEAVSRMNEINCQKTLETLSDLSLVSEFGEDKFGLHDLLALYAKEKVDKNPNKSKWTEKLLEFYSEYIQKNKHSYDSLDDVRINIISFLKGYQNGGLELYFICIENIQSYLKDRGLWNDLLLLGEKAIKLFEDKPKEKAYISTWILSWVYFQQNDITKAYEMATKSLELYDLSADPVGKASAKRRLGMSSIMLGRYEEARKWLNEALEEFKKANIPLKIGDTYCLLGYLNRKETKYDEAQHNLELSLKLVEDDEKETSMTLYNFGRLKSSLGQNIEAIEFHSKSMVIDEKLNRKPGIGYNLFRIGQIEIFSEDAEIKNNAIAKLLKAKSIFSELGNLKKIDQIEEILNKQ